MKNKIILDACCGDRCFWFDKKNKDVLFIDIRKEKKGFIKARPNFEINPDIIMDFRKLDFADKSFKLIVFDPPHLVKLGKTSWLAKKYGILDKSWREDLKKGFDECWRVLDDNGVLIFKWNEYDIKVSEVIKVLGRDPLFGHPTARNKKTKWLCFMKINIKL